MIYLSDGQHDRVRPEAFGPLRPEYDTPYWQSVVTRLAAHSTCKPSGCWETTYRGHKGYETHKSYHQIYAGGRYWYVHVLAYTLFVGDIPDGFEIDHTCDNGLCNNVAHLQALAKGPHRRKLRGPKRKRTTSARLLPNREAVLSMKREGRSNREIAAQFGSTPNSIATTISRWHKQIAHPN